MSKTHVITTPQHGTRLFRAAGRQALCLGTFATPAIAEATRAGFEETMTRAEVGENSRKGAEPRRKAK